MNKIKKILKSRHKKLRDKLKEWRLKIGYRIWDKTSPVLPFPKINEINRILFIRHDGKLGDYMVSSFVYRELKKAKSNLIIDVISHQNIRYLFDDNPYINHIYIPKKRNLLTFFKLGKKLKTNQYDIVIDTTEVLRNRDLALLKGIQAQYYIGYNQNLKLFNINLPASEDHVTLDYQKILYILGLKNIDSTYDIPHHIDSENKIQDFLNQNHIKQYVALNFFGASRSRTFNLEMQELIIEKIIHDTDFNIVLLGYPAVEAELNTLINKFHSTRLYFYSPSQNIYDSIAIISKADYIITPDTSIVHIASGLNKPIIAFYDVLNTQSLKKWHPNSDHNVKIIQYSEYINDINIEQVNLNPPNKSLN